jgi:hypothetical protein
MIGVIRWAFRRNQREVVVLLWNGGSTSYYVVRISHDMCDDAIEFGDITNIYAYTTTLTSLIIVLCDVTNCSL